MVRISKNKSSVKCNSKSKRSKLDNRSQVNEDSSNYVDLTGARQSHSSAAANVQKRRLDPNTRAVYKGKLRKAIEYFRCYHPEAVTTTVNGAETVYSINHINLTVEHVNNFLGHQTKDALDVAESPILAGSVEFDQLLEDKTLLAYQTVSGHVSALKNVYKDLKLDVPQDLNNTMNEFLHGYIKIIADLKAQGKMKDFEGKRYIKFLGYTNLMKLLYTCSPRSETSYLKKLYNTVIFFTLMITFSWNLIQRSETIANINLEHMTWINDALCIKVFKTKNDASGEKGDGTK